jgi:nitrate reductase gamma subunit
MIAEFARGPLVWISFAIFIGGSIYKLIWLYNRSKKDKVVHPYMNLKFGLRSLMHWIIPFGSRNMRLRPFFTIYSFIFHICLLITPIFVLGHIVLWNESWGISWPHLPEELSNVMAIIVVVTVVLFFLRRIADPTVRFVTSWTDYLLLTFVALPFATGILAYYQALDYDTVITLHMISGNIWIAMIPFTRIVHMLFFPFTRAYMGSEFGYVRSARDW